MPRHLRSALLLFAAICLSAASTSADDAPRLDAYFKQYINLTDAQISDIRNGHAVAKLLPSRTPDEIFVFGAVYVNAKPEAYLDFARDLNRLRSFSGYLDLQPIHQPPQASDFTAFRFEPDDIKDLQSCRPNNCEIQMPASSIELLQRQVNWSDPNAADKVNAMLQAKALASLAAYQQSGNSALGVYNDKKAPVEVAERFQYMLGYSKALPRYLPDFYNYLLNYPKGRPAGTEDMMYWARVKFGLKPTLRVVQVITYNAEGKEGVAYAVAEKQLYSSHYFQTALDLTFCIRDLSHPSDTGFYLIKLMGSEQAGLTGFKGSIIRKVATDRTATSLQKSLATIKGILEQPH